MRIRKRTPYLVDTPGVRCEDGQPENHAEPRIIRVIDRSENMKSVFWRETTREVSIQSLGQVSISGSSLGVVGSDPFKPTDFY